MRILHILDHSVPLHSGYAFRTLEILRHQRRLGWETAQITSSKHQPATQLEEVVDGFRFHRTFPSNNLLQRIPVLQHLSVIWDLEGRLQKVARDVRADLLHAHSPALTGVAALRVGQRLGIPVVYEVRAFWEDGAVDHGITREGSLRYRLSRALETHVLKRAAAVTTISEGLRRDIAARAVPEAKVTVVPNAVDVEHFSAARCTDSLIRRRLGLTGKQVLGFIGSYYGYEGLDLLLTALPWIRAEVPNVHLLLVGGGRQERSLQQQAAGLGILEHVQFIGRVPHERVQDYYSLVDILVYPRRSMRLTELVTPLKPLEAMAQGRLLVASDVGGHRELIRHGETGILFRAGDARALAEAVVGLLNEPERWAGLRAAARSFVERERSWSAVVLRYQPIYERLAMGKAHTENSMRGAPHRASPPATGAADREPDLRTPLARG
jgi:PEP-CTERM/exosortase A-associated glycosyltransferase